MAVVLEGLWILSCFSDAFVTLGCKSCRQIVWEMSVTVFFLNQAQCILIVKIFSRKAQRKYIKNTALISLVPDEMSSLYRLQKTAPGCGTCISEFRTPFLFFLCVCVCFFPGEERITDWGMFCAHN